tara:strand:+ start:491 stop:1009 length:519 start_codon:yes stop_codon:yes gene_type:complete
MESNIDPIDNSIHLTHDKWNMYYHLPHDNDWSISGYKLIMSNINNIEDVNLLTKNINENIIKNCMLFVMRHNIEPLWEHEENRNGGCFSYKILNKYVHNVWNDLFKLLCGESLVDSDISKHINGITISPKKNFCIIKIWLNNLDYQDPSIINNIENLTLQGCIFKKHKPEDD